MEILFSNGTDKLQITLPDRTLAAEEWFTAPLALQVGGLNFYISNDFQKEDFDSLQKSMGYDKAMKLFYAFAGDNAIKNLNNYNAGQETPEIAAYKLKELMADPETAKLLAKNDPKTHKEVLRLTELSMKK